MNYKFVTSFSQKGYDLYGRIFLESYIKHCPYPLEVWHESQEAPSLPGRIEWSDLDWDKERDWFLTTFRKYDGRNGYRFNATGFCHKVFALAATEFDKWLIWIDADTVFKKDIDQRFFDETCPEGFTASYLGRKDWDHSECGFVGYNKQYRGNQFLTDFQELYTSSLLFELPQWHDSYAFDAIRRSYERQGCLFFNIAKGVPKEAGFVKGVPHPWPHTVLGGYIEHRKGPEAKARAYG